MAELLGAVGRGLVAGAVGTAAITASRAVEAKLRGDEPSTAPAEAAEKVLDIEPADAAAEAPPRERRALVLRALWGVPRGLLSAAGLGQAAATGTHGVVVWGAGLATLPALRITPPPWRWGAQRLAIDGLHHAIYAAAAGLAYAALSRAG